MHINTFIKYPPFSLIFLLENRNISIDIFIINLPSKLKKSFHVFIYSFDQIVDPSKK